MLQNCLTVPLPTTAAIFGGEGKELPHAVGERGTVAERNDKRRIDGREHLCDRAGIECESGTPARERLDE